MKKKNMRYALIVLVVVILVTTIMTISNPLRKSEEGIRKDMLELTPIGTSMAEVIKVIKSNKKWEIEWTDNEGGFEADADGYPDEGSDIEIGEKSMRVYMGTYNYRILFPVHVEIYYGFDKESKLVDIAISKDMDTL